MAIDAYQDAAPTISSVTTSAWVIDGVAYFWKIIGTSLTAWADVYITHSGNPETPERSWMYIWYGNSWVQAKIEQWIHFEQRSIGYFSGDTLTYKCPLSYTRQSVARIIHGVCESHLGMTINTASFNAGHTHFASDYRSAAILRKPCLEIFKAIMEQTEQAYIYINNSGELAFDWLNNQSQSKDYDLSIDDVNSINRFHTIADRAYPSSVNYGWLPRDFPPGNPKALNWIPSISPSFGNPPINGEYRAEYIDEKTISSGSFVSWDDFMMLELNVNHVGFVYDLGDFIQLQGFETLGLNKNHYFVIHKIVMNPENMTCDLTLISGVGWNIPI